MAERVGFEPTIPVKVCPLSRRIVSTTHAPLRIGRKENFNCKVLRKRRSGFRQRAHASLTPAKRLNFRGGSFQPLTHLSASDERKTLIARSFAKDAQDFGSGLTLRSRPLNASTFEADRFNHSRTSPHHSQCRVVSGAWRNMFSGKLAMATAGCQQLLFFSSAVAEK
jgi:hypothetical protein